MKNFLKKDKEIKNDFETRSTECMRQMKSLKIS